jgi:hypothetical protein
MDAMEACDDGGVAQGHGEREARYVWRLHRRQKRRKKKEKRNEKMTNGGGVLPGREGRLKAIIEME